MGTAQLAEPATRRWTREEYYRMAELGMFRGQRVELLEGEIVVMSPQKYQHYSTTDRVADVLRTTLGVGFWVRVQAPIAVNGHSEPEPDVSVVAGTRDDYTSHPETALLIVEVSDTTLANDRGRKASLYARAGVADYWIVNLVDRRLEVYRHPIPDKAQKYGFAYADTMILTETDSVKPLARPKASIPVAALFPPKKARGGKKKSERKGK